MPVTNDYFSRSFRQSGVPRADSPRWLGGQSMGPSGRSTISRRTVWKHCPNNQYCTSKNGRSVPYLRTVRPARTVRQTSSKQKQSTRWIETKRRKNSWWTWRIAGCRAPRGRSARGGQSSLSLKMRSQPLVSIHGSPNQLNLLRHDLGEMWSVPSRFYAPKLEPSNELNRREPNHSRAIPKS
jgi:hypothetical protein